MIIKSHIRGGYPDCLMGLQIGASHNAEQRVGLCFVNKSGITLMGNLVKVITLPRQLPVACQKSFCPFRVMG